MAQASAAQMLAGADITGDQGMSQIAQDALSTPEPDESQLPQYKTFDSEQVGTVGTILGGLVQQAPSLATMIVNPVAGAVLAGAQGFTEAHAEGAKLGLTGADLEDYAATGGTTAGIGAAIPGFTGVGKGLALYGSRFVAGGLVNSVTGEIDRWGRADILESAGFHEQARQMRQADAASRVTEFVLGGAFGLLGGRKRTDGTNPIEQKTDTKEALLLNNDQPHTGAFITDLEQKASQLISRGNRKLLQSEIANSQRILDRLTTQRNSLDAIALKGSGKSLSQARQERVNQLADIDAQIAEARTRLQDATNVLEPNLPGGTFYSAKAELSRISQRQRDQQSLVSSIHEDAAIAHTLHDNYVTESAPGLATDARSESGHVAAMDTAIDSLNHGRGVDVSEHLNDNSFIVRGDLDAGNLERQQLSGGASKKIDAIATAADGQVMPDRSLASYPPGVLSDATNQPFQILRDKIDAVAESHPELRDLVAQHVDNFEAEYNSAHRNAEQYDIAAACALKFGS
ncbi:hypothetical protein KC222_04150 [Cedecea davisae]|uniref:Uncharacterized protein n=1 Tax=Cedecea davisae TaxID=158484 RepID=A0ABS6DDE3_9ENTR|nr:hypothetical protein [Cedecea davisae]MBU4681203.1 hypothetical protein [Cedecea davisae]MBU4685064.1 hypothetical protein [Cedecea davisae]